MVHYCLEIRHSMHMQAMIDMDKVLFVAKFCGKPLASRSKCGGKKSFGK